MSLATGTTPDGAAEDPYGGCFTPEKCTTCATEDCTGITKGHYFTYNLIKNSHSAIYTLPTSLRPHYTLAGWELLGRGIILHAVGNMGVLWKYCWHSQ